MRLLYVKADTIAGLTLGISKDPKAYMLTLSLVKASILLLWGQYREVVIDRVLDDHPIEVKAWYDRRRPIEDLVDIVQAELHSKSNKEYFKIRRIMLKILTEEQEGHE